MQADFVQRVLQHRRASGSDALLWLAPAASRLPLAYLRYDDPALPYSRALINATAGVVCGWAFDMAAYMAFGAAGAVALERSAALAAGRGLTILHGPFITPDYAAMLDGGLAFDAVTLAAESLRPAYTQSRQRGAFVLSGAAGGKTPAGDVFEPAAGLFRVGGGSEGAPLVLRLVDPLATAAKGDDEAAFLQSVRALAGHDE